MSKTSYAKHKSFSTCENNNIISKAQCLGEVDTVWVLHNWDMEFETLKSRAECFINLGHGIRLQLFLKDQVSHDGDKAEPGRSNVFRSYSAPGELNYPIDFNLPREERVIEIRNVNAHHEKFVIDKFLPLSMTNDYNTQFALKTQFKKPNILKFCITAKLLCHSVSEGVFQGSKQSNLSISQDFMSMLKEEDNYSDIKLETEDGIVTDAHKFVLAARSPVLRAQIEKKMRMNDFNGVITVNMDAKTLEHVLKWMYSGELHENSETNLENVLRAAVAYELTELLVILDKKLVQICTVENMLHLMQTANMYELSQASKDIAEFIKTNVDKMVVSSAAKILSPRANQGNVQE
ncbi:unnamed protein product [Orchesella dallaii]|uniref:BTB domain-containing protein n=1 Tax=Orchesella dallaii TaxID=48710 RepID=A0ABP1SA74_9HEXA